MLGPIAKDDDLVDRSDTVRAHLLRCLLERFSAAFPGIDFSVMWESDHLNAQAILTDGRRGVVVLGGLARHSALSENGLAVAIAHEVGHHLGGRPFDRDFPWLSVEGQADYWATRVGMKRIYPREEVLARSLQGAGELVDLYRGFYRPWRGASGRVVTPRRVLSPKSRWLTFRAGALGNRRPRCACA